MAFDRVREAPSPTRVERFFDALLARDGAGGSWLSALLCAAPRGAQHLGELAEGPGWLEVTVAVRTETGRRGAFEYPAAPSRRLLAWFIDHPEALGWPAQERATAETIRLRRALLGDDPPGVRARAQDRAHDLLRRSPPLGAAWWRFEDAHRCDCVLVTDRLVLLVRSGDVDEPATPWFTERRGRVRDLEAAQRLADGGKAWGVLTLVEAPGREDAVAALARAVDVGAPHLDAAERAVLRDGDLGELGWDQAAAVTGVDLAAVS